MAVPWAISDTKAKSIYTRMCNYYNSPDNLPNHINDSGVFYGYDNFTRDKLWYCVEFMKQKWGDGWFTNDYSTRSTALRNIANQLYNTFGGSVNVDGIFKFLNWIYSFANHDTTALEYFQKGYYDYAKGLLDTATNAIVYPVTEVVEDIAYGLKQPSFTWSNPAVKWGLIIGGGILAYKLIKGR